MPLNNSMNWMINSKNRKKDINNKYRSWNRVIDRRYNIKWKGIKIYANRYNNCKQNTQVN